MRWSPTVLDELSRALVRTRPEYTGAKALRLVTAMTAALPDAWVLPPDPPTLAVDLPDADDAHVVLASCLPRRSGRARSPTSRTPAAAGSS